MNNSTSWNQKNKTPKIGIKRFQKLKINNQKVKNKKTNEERSQVHTGERDKNDEECLQDYMVSRKDRPKTHGKKIN